MGFESCLYDQVHRRITLYDQNIKNQSGGAAERGVPRTLIAPSDLPTVKLVTDGRKTWLVGEDGVSLGIFTKSQATFKNTGVERLHNFILQDQACKLYLNIVFVIV